MRAGGVLECCVSQTASWVPRGDAEESCALVRYVCGDRCRHTLKGKRRRQHLAQRWQTALAHEQTCDSLGTRIAPLKDDIQSGIAHPCRDGA